MSHNTQVANVKINDLDALQSAINELRNEGVRIDFHQNGRFRTWPGQPDRCDATISLPDERFDIGLTKDKDGNYVPVFDHMLASNRSIACEYTPGERRSDRHTIGKLMQRYTVCKAEKEAALQGHMVTSRSTDPVTGEISLTVET